MKFKNNQLRIRNNHTSKMVGWVDFNNIIRPSYIYILLLYFIVGNLMLFAQSVYFFGFQNFGRSPRYKIRFARNFVIRSILTVITCNPLKQMLNVRI